MTAKEFSDQFDVGYNNITSNQAPGLNEYDKSVFLTKAQDELLKDYFNPESNPKRQGFDDNRKRQMDFSGIMKVASPTVVTDTVPQLDARAFVYRWPKDVLYIINESLDVGRISSDTSTGLNLKPRQVVSLTYNDYEQLMSRPFKAPLKYQAWRLITGYSDGKTLVEIIIGSADKKGLYIGGSQKAPRYSIRYVKIPRPILLADFSQEYGEDLSIDNLDGSGDYDFNNPCELHPSIHKEILQRAVELAKIAWAGTQEEIAAAQLQVTSGQRSE